jgi:hypothetical protein
MDPGLDHLRRHGDVDAGPGPLDFAVTVRGEGPPRRLRDRPAGSPDGPGRYPVARVLTDESDGHRLPPTAVPTAADLVVVGNLTNPTGIPHPTVDVAAPAAPAAHVDRLAAAPSEALAVAA